MDKVSLPTTGSQKKSTKDSVILLLSHEFPLSANQVYSRLRKQFALSVSYQAVHKVLTQLLEEKVLVKEGKNYFLSKQWISSIKKFGLNLDSQYSENKRWEILGEKLETQKTIVIPLTGIQQTARFLFGHFFRLENPERKPNIALWRNCYSILGLSEDDYLDLDAGIMKNFYAISSEDNPADRMFAETLSKLGIHILLGIKEVATTLSDTFVVGDFVGTVWYSSKFRNAWYLQNKLPKKIDDFDMAQHLKLMRNEKTQIIFIGAKEPLLADMIREQYLPLFKI